MNPAWSVPITFSSGRYGFADYNTTTNNCENKSIPRRTLPSEGINQSVIILFQSIWGLLKGISWKTLVTFSETPVKRKAQDEDWRNTNKQAKSETWKMRKYASKYAFKILQCIVFPAPFEIRKAAVTLYPLLVYCKGIKKWRWWDFRNDFTIVYCQHLICCKNLPFVLDLQ